MKLRHALLAFAAGTALLTGPAFAVNLQIVSGSVGNDLKVLQDELKVFEAQTGNHVDVVSMPSSTTDQFGQYKLWLAAQNSDIDVYRTDVIWAPQLANQFIDLTAATKDIAKQNFPAIIESQTVNGKLVALPMFTDAPALYYRKDLLDKYGATPPKTWKEMAATAKMVMDKERAAGNKDMWGFVFQGNAYEGLTCDALEWVKSYGGGQIVEPDGKISIDNPAGRRRPERGQELDRHDLARRRPVLPGRRVRVASGRPAMPSSCATGPMPTRSAIAATRPSRASSTLCRCPWVTARMPVRRPPLAAGTWRCPSIPSTRRKRSSWSSSWPDPSSRRSTRPSS